MSFITQKAKISKKGKKKPPPRPPPPDFSKYKSHSAFSINQQIDNLIDWSPPSSPKVERIHNFGGSVSSSFSSSTSSLASSKKSLEYDSPVTNNLWPINISNATPPTLQIQNNYFYVPNQNANNVPTNNSTSVIYTSSSQQASAAKINIPAIFGPTIIKARAPKPRLPKEPNAFNSDPPSPPLPMPSIPPPSPPKEASNIDIAYGIALYDYSGSDFRDLSFQANDIVILLRRVNEEWYYGKVLDKEGMFPANYIEVQVPLVNNGNHTVMALYEFVPQMNGDLALKPGQLIKVIRKINSEWLYGESNGQYGQFPTNFIDRLPDL